MLNRNNSIFYLVIALVAVLGIGAGVVAYTGQNNGTVIESQVVQGDYVSSPEVEEPSFGAFPGPEIYQDLTVHGYVSSYMKTTVLAPTAVSATTTLTSHDNNTNYLLSSKGVLINLPTVADGLRFRFTINGAADTANFVIDSSEGDNIEGTLIVAGAVVDCNAVDQINFVTDGENIGDYFDIYSDGTQWLLGDSGVLTAAKLTCTDPS